MAEEFDATAAPNEDPSNPFFNSEAKELLEKYQQALHEQSLEKERLESLLTEYDELSDRSQQQEQIITDLRRELRTLNAKRLQEDTGRLDEEQEARQQQLEHAMREVTKTKKRLEAAERELLELRHSKETPLSASLDQTAQRLSLAAAAASTRPRGDGSAETDAELERQRIEVQAKYSHLAEQFKHQRDLFDEERAEKERLQQELERLRGLLDARFASARSEEASTLADELGQEFFAGAAIAPAAHLSLSSARAHQDAHPSSPSPLIREQALQSAAEQERKRREEEDEARRVRELEAHIARLSAERDALAQQHAATAQELAIAASRQQTLLAQQQQEAAAAIQAEITRRVEAEATARANWERAQQLAVQAADAEELRLRLLTLADQQARQAATIAELERSATEAGRTQAEAGELAKQLAAARERLARMEREVEQGRKAMVASVHASVAEGSLGHTSSLTSPPMPPPPAAAAATRAAVAVSVSSLEQLQADRARFEAAADVARAEYQQKIIQTRAVIRAPRPESTTAPPISKRLTILRLAREYSQHDPTYIANLAEAFAFNEDLIRAELAASLAPALQAPPPTPSQPPSTAPAPQLAPSAASPLSASPVFVTSVRSMPSEMRLANSAGVSVSSSSHVLRQLAAEFPPLDADTLQALLQANDNNIDRTRQDLQGMARPQLSATPSLAPPPAPRRELQQLAAEFPQADPSTLAHLLIAFNNDMQAVRAEMLVHAAAVLDTGVTRSPSRASAARVTQAAPSALQRLVQLYPGYNRDTLSEVLKMHAGNIDAAVADLGPPPVPSVPSPSRSLSAPHNKPSLSETVPYAKSTTKAASDEEHPPPYTLGVPPAYVGPAISPQQHPKSPGPTEPSPASPRLRVASVHSSSPAAASAVREGPMGTSDLQFAVSLGSCERVFQVSLSPHDNVPQLGLTRLKSPRCTLKVTPINVAIMSRDQHAPIVDWPISALRAIDRIDSGLSITGFYVPLGRFIVVRMLCTEAPQALAELRRAINEAQRRADETTAIEMQRQELSQLRDLPEGSLRNMNNSDEFASVIAQFSGLTQEELKRLDAGTVEQSLAGQDAATKRTVMDRYFSFLKKGNRTQASPSSASGPHAPSRTHSLSMSQTEAVPVAPLYHATPLQTSSPNTGPPSHFLISPAAEAHRTQSAPLSLSLSSESGSVRARPARPPPLQSAQSPQQQVPSPSGPVYRDEPPPPRMAW